MEKELMRYDAETNTLTIGHNEIDTININVEFLSDVTGNITLQNVNGKVTHGTISQETVKTNHKRENIYIRLIKKLLRMLNW